jgi:hypothetical protein
LGDEHEGDDLADSDSEDPYLYETKKTDPRGSNYSKPISDNDCFDQIDYYVEDEVEEVMRMSTSQAKRLELNNSINCRNSMATKNPNSFIGIKHNQSSVRATEVSNLNSSRHSKVMSNLKQ